MEALAALLRRLRERAQLSQVDVSTAAGLSETYYGKIEGGERRPSGDVLLRILEVIRCEDAERHEAVRLYMRTRFPEAILEHLTPRPQPGTAAPPVVPSRKPALAAPSPARRRRRRALGWLIAALVMGWGSADASPYPSMCDATGSLLSDLARRWFGIPRPCPA